MKTTIVIILAVSVVAWFVVQISKVFGVCPYSKSIED